MRVIRSHGRKFKKLGTLRKKIMQRAGRIILSQGKLVLSMATKDVAIEQGVKVRYVPITDHQCALNSQALDTLPNKKMAH
ncbi:MAG: hypothetical protein ACI8VC_001516 [Candidatus Endobugula sp.]|jgi:hypothetical protein